MSTNLDECLVFFESQIKELSEEIKKMKKDLSSITESYQGHIHTFSSPSQPCVTDGPNK